jgi:hypothetical protein
MLEIPHVMCQVGGASEGSGPAPMLATPAPALTRTAWSTCNARYRSGYACARVCAKPARPTITPICHARRYNLRQRSMVVRLGSARPIHLLWCGRLLLTPHAPHAPASCGLWRAPVGGGSDLLATTRDRGTRAAGGRVMALFRRKADRIIDDAHNAIACAEMRVSTHTRMKPRLARWMN